MSAAKEDARRLVVRAELALEDARSALAGALAEFLARPEPFTAGNAADLRRLSGVERAALSSWIDAMEAELAVRGKGAR